MPYPHITPELEMSHIGTPQKKRVVPLVRR